MSASLIIDCSITMSWCFSDEATPEAQNVLDRLELETALVPALWFLEVVNVLAMTEKRRRITAAKSAEFLARLHVLNIEVDHDAADRAFAHLLPVCRASSLTAYDAAYLDLAVRRQLPLASLDTGLRKAATSLSIELLGR